MNFGTFGETFPYTNFHDLNLDWIISVVREVKETYPGLFENLMNIKLNKPYNNPNGNLGDYLVSNGDGTTSWKPFDEDIAAEITTAVYEWLADHPEVTTTVQDRSISESKLTNDVLDDVLYRGTKLEATRAFRIIKPYPNETYTGLGGQCMATSPSNTILCGGRLDNDNQYQRITELALDGEIIRYRNYNDTILGHFNGITCMGGNLYVCTGSTNVITVFRYDTLAITAHYTIPNIASIIGIGSYNDILYCYGRNSDYELVFGTLNLETSVFTEIARMELLENSGVVLQDMCVNATHAFFPINLSNQIMVLNIDSGEMNTLPLDVGDGMYPYGEIESATFINNQLWFMSSCWTANYQIDVSMTQFFKTNIGGELIIKSFVEGQTATPYVTVNVNISGEDSQSKNPDGTTTNPFLTCFEASLFINYLSVKYPFLRIALQVSTGNSHDYSTDLLILNNANCYIRTSPSLISIKNVVLTNGIYVMRQIKCDTLTIQTSAVLIFQGSTITSMIAKFCPIVVLGTGITCQSFNFEGCYVVPYSKSQIQYMTLTNTTLSFEQTTTTTLQNTDFSQTNWNFTRNGDIVVLFFDGSLSGLTQAQQNTIGTLPALYRPLSSFQIDGSDPDGRSYRLYVNTNGTVTILPRSSTSLSNLRIYVPYLRA